MDAHLFNYMTELRKQLTALNKAHQRLHKKYKEAKKDLAESQEQVNLLIEELGGFEPVKRLVPVPEEEDGLSGEPENVLIAEWIDRED